MSTSNLENNIVFESIQPCLLDLVNSSNSEILYANGFSGTPPVAMPEDLANLFKSDFGMVGTNILVQLENKMNGVPGGPWYIDSRNDCIYIHNRNFQDLSVYTYEYMAGSGELLDVSFKTNYVKKQVQGGIQSGVNQDKEIKQDIVLAPELTLRSVDWQPTSYFLTPYNSDSYGLVNSSTNTYIDLEVPSAFDFVDEIHQRSLFGTKDNSDKELLNLYHSADSDQEAQALFDNKINNARIEAYYNQLSLDDLKRESQSIFEQTSTNLGITQEQLMSELQEAMDSGNLESYLQRVFGSSNHLFDNPQMFGTRPTTVKVHELDLFQLGIPYAGQHSGSGAHISVGDTNMDYVSINRGTYASSYSGPSVEEAARSAGRMRSEDLLNSINNNSEVVEVLEVGDLKITPLPDDDPRYSTSFYQAIYSQRVKILVNSETNAFSIPTYRIISDLYTRQLGENSTLKDVEAHVRKLIHANDAVMEKVITCRLTCIGNPFLASSQVLTLKNVGVKWSGKWYIKTCKHNFNNSGYTCLLDLVLNSSLPGSSSVSTGITLDQPWDRNALREVMMNVTSAESLYYSSLGETRDKVDFILLLISNKLLENEHQDEFNDRGIVRVSSTTSTTSKISSVEYTLDPKVKKIPDEIRETYESAAKKAVQRNNFTEFTDNFTEFVGKTFNGNNK